MTHIIHSCTWLGARTFAHCNLKSTASTNYMFQKKALSNGCDNVIPQHAWYIFLLFERNRQTSLVYCQNSNQKNCPWNFLYCCCDYKLDKSYTCNKVIKVEHGLFISSTQCHPFNSTPVISLNTETFPICFFGTSSQTSNTNWTPPFACRSSWAVLPSALYFNTVAKTFIPQIFKWVISCWNNSTGKIWR